MVEILPITNTEKAAPVILATASKDSYCHHLRFSNEGRALFDFGDVFTDNQVMRTGISNSNYQAQIMLK